MIASCVIVSNADNDRRTYYPNLTDTTVTDNKKENNMILKYVSGCVCDSLTVDNVETVDMKVEDVRKVIMRLLESEDDIGFLQQILIDFIESRGDYEHDDEPCECCGDYVTTYTLKL